MDKSSPLVSVIVTCYNYGDYVEESIKSVVLQTYKNIRLFVINDGSTDNSDEVIKRVKKHHDFEYVLQENSGVVATRNLALDLAVGDYVIQLDADDWLDSNYIEELVKHARKSRADVVYTDYKKFGSIIETSSFPQFSIEILKNKNYIHISSLVKVRAIKNTRFDNNLQKLSHEDWEFFLNLALQRCVFSKCDTTYLNYRIHDSARNNTQTSLAEHREYAQVYTYTIEKLRDIYPDELNYLASTYFADWFIHSDKHLEIVSKELKRAQNEIKLKAAHIENLECIIRDLKISQKKTLVETLKYKVKRSK